MNNPFDYTPSEECADAFRELVAGIESLKGSNDPGDIEFLRELEAGKMLGVLIASDHLGKRHTLYAFSGQLGDSGFLHPGFVDPAFDYLRPDGYFKQKEREISRWNTEITEFERGTLAELTAVYECAKEKADAEVLAYKEQCRLSKEKRDKRRRSGMTDDAEEAAMIRESQFEKAELRRIKKRVSAELAPLDSDLQSARKRLADMKERRRADSEALQQWLFSNFTLLNARGESKSLSEIFAETPMGIPPSGAGECCAPKLLQAAYVQGLQPEAIAEYWYGQPKDGEVRIHGHHYPACRGKCLPILRWMLQGLPVNPPLDGECMRCSADSPRIVFENEWFCVIDKPAGMLSVPGKGNAVSVQQWLEARYGDAREVKLVHRLDQDTSGLLIAVFGARVYKELQSLFARRKVKKRYVAVLEGDFSAREVPQQGCIELPLSPDWLDRPRQRVDLECGKEAVTEYEFEGVSDGKSKVILYPHTGRTHQLRVHAAAGLSMPIVGDRLYGRSTGFRSERLHLHANRIEFTFPLDGKDYSFESAVPF